MSFSGRVKEELASVIPSARHCQLAELSSILQFCGKIIPCGQTEFNSFFIKIQTENKLVARKSFTLLKKGFNIYAGAAVRQNRKQSVSLIYILTVREHKDVVRILQTFKWYDDVLARKQFDMMTHSVLLKSNCCKRSFMRGVYLAAGSMSDPAKSYHLEYVCQRQEDALFLVDVLGSFALAAKIVQRKKYYVVYLKEGESIVDLLNVMEAHKALMELENTRILKEVRNSVNRRVNCEAANITKTVNAAARQMEDIVYIREHYGLENLPDNLYEIAIVRLENPEASLKELGELLSPKVGKSGVNHRLRKLMEIAERLRNE